MSDSSCQLPSAVFAKGLTVAIRCLKDSPPDAQVCRHALNFLRAALRSRYHSETKQVASDQGLLSTTASIAQRTSDRAIFDRANSVLEALGGTPSGPRSHLPLVQAGEPQTQLDKMTALLTNRISLLVVSCPALTNIYPARHCGRYGDDWHFAAFFDSMHQQVRESFLFQSISGIRVCFFSFPHFLKKCHGSFLQGDLVRCKCGVRTHRLPG